MISGNTRLCLFNGDEALQLAKLKDRGIRQEMERHQSAVKETTDSRACGGAMAIISPRHLRADHGKVLGPALNDVLNIRGRVK